MIKKKYFFFDPKTKKIKHYKVKEKISFIFNIKKNIYLIGLSSGVYFYNIKKNIYRLIESTKIISKYERTNDAAIAPDGCLYYTILDERKKSNGRLIKLNKNLKISILQKNLITPNGPLFLKSKGRYLLTDSSRKKVFICSKKQKKIFLKFDKNHPSPDGMTIDNQGLIYISLFGGSKIMIFDQNSKYKSEICLSAKFLTNCKFLGTTNKILITSACRKILNKKKGDNGKFFLAKTKNHGIKNFNLNYKFLNNL